MSQNNLDYYFQALTLDNNGEVCTDINVGLKNLFEPFNEQKPTMRSSQYILAGEVEEGYPDLIAYKSVLSSQDLWWWVLLACRLDDAFEGIKSNYVYPIFLLLTITELQIASTSEENNNTTTGGGNTIGDVVELN